MRDWLPLAACRGRDPEDWDVLGALTASNIAALRTCAACPVMDDCDADYVAAPATRRQSVIAGGRIYDDKGYPLATVAARFAAGAMLCAADKCLNELPAGRIFAQGKYCSSRCRRRTEDRRWRAKQRAKQRQLAAAGAA